MRSKLRNKAAANELSAKIIRNDSPEISGAARIRKTDITTITSVNLSKAIAAVEKPKLILS
jgi:hypothetical protein